MDHFRLPKEYISATKKDLKLRCFHVQCSELAQHTTACSALAGAAHKSSHAPKKRLQTEAAGHQPCNNSLLQNHFLLLKQSLWPAWSLKRMGQIHRRHKAQFFAGVWFLGAFFCYNKGGLRLAEARTGYGGRGEDWETTELPTHGQVWVFYSQEKRNCRSKSLKWSKSYILMGAWGLLMARPAEKSEGRKTNLLKADLVKWSLARTDKRVLSRRLK